MFEGTLATCCPPPGATPAGADCEESSHTFDASFGLRGTALHFDPEACSVATQNIS